MPKVPKRKNRKIPDGYDMIEPTIKDFERKMREGTSIYLCMYVYSNR